MFGELAQKNVFGETKFYKFLDHLYILKIGLKYFTVFVL